MRYTRVRLAVVGNNAEAEAPQGGLLDVTNKACIKIDPLI